MLPNLEGRKHGLLAYPSTEPGVGAVAGTRADVGRLEVQLLNC